MSRMNEKGIWGIVVLAAGMVFAAGSVTVVSAAGISEDPRTAEQAYKNIQVLKGLPESQLIGVMAYMQASIGAKDCQSCHVRSGENLWEWEKDDNPKKQTARRMVQLVLDVNKASFNGRPEVTCYTCHQGHEHPVATPSLPLASAEAGPSAPRPAGKFPTPNELVDRYVQAIGGKDSAARLSAMVLKGTQTGQNGATMQVEVNWKAPGKLLSAVTTPGGVFSQVFDGTAGWIQVKNGMREMNQSELERMKDMGSVYDPLKIHEPYPRMRLAAKEKIGERDAWVLRTQGQGNKSERLYFDTETGLLLRKVTMTPTMVGTIPEQIDFEDYREVDGVRLPFRIRMTGLIPQTSWDQKFATILSDPAIADGKFAKPAGESKPEEQR